jgi:hypothetical protein
LCGCALQLQQHTATWARPCLAPAHLPALAASRLALDQRAGSPGPTRTCWLLFRLHQVEETEDKLELHHLMQANQRQQQQLVAQLKDAFAADDTEQALQLTTQLTYVVRLGQAILEKI